MGGQYPPWAPKANEIIKRSIDRNKRRRQVKMRQGL